MSATVAFFLGGAIGAVMSYLFFEPMGYERGWAAAWLAKEKKKENKK